MGLCRQDACAPRGWRKPEREFTTETQSSTEKERGGDINFIFFCVLSAISAPLR